jgi:hypothetical protein
MANPEVRPNLHFYPEDSGAKLSEARQAERWLKEMQPDELTPMIRSGEDDYYIYEPAMLIDGSCCIPTRWFIRDGIFFCKAWALHPISADGHGQGWQVREDIEVEVSQNEFLKNFPNFTHDHQLYGVPHPSRIIGMEFLNKLLFYLTIFQRCGRRLVQTFRTAGPIPTPFSATVGVSKRKESLWQLFHFGCTVMTPRVMFRRSGMNTTASCSPSLAYQVTKPPENSIYIFYAPQIWHLLLKCLTVLSTNLSTFLYS